MKAPERIVRWMMLCSFVNNTAYSVCAPILLIEFAKHGLDGYHVGLCFSIYAVGNIFFAPIVGKYLVNKVESRNLYGFAFCLMGTCFVLFGLIEQMENATNIVGKN